MYSEIDIFTVHRVVSDLNLYVKNSCIWLDTGPWMALKGMEGFAGVCLVHAVSSHVHELLQFINILVHILTAHNGRMDEISFT